MSFFQKVKPGLLEIVRISHLYRIVKSIGGMSEELGPLNFGRKEEQIFLGREIAQHRDYSEQTAVLIDKEVRRVVDQAGERAVGLIDKYLDQLKNLARVLLEREILDGEEIEKVLKGEDLGPPREWKNNRADRKAGGDTGGEVGAEPEAAVPADAAVDTAADEPGEIGEPGAGEEDRA